MRASEIYGLVIRIMGMLLGVYGIITADQWLYSSRVSSALLFGVPYFWLTLYLLRGAPHIIRFSYPEQGKTEADKQDLQNKESQATPE